MINVPWLPVRPGDQQCGHRRNKRSVVPCELPPDHDTVYVGGLLYPWHLGRDKAGRWHSW